MLKKVLVFLSLIPVIIGFFILPFWEVVIMALALFIIFFMVFSALNQLTTDIEEMKTDIKNDEKQLQNLRRLIKKREL